MEGKTGNKRMVHYDLLRILAAFSVVMLHTSAQFWYTLDINSLEWKIADSYDALSRFGVPVFVMLSGALLLSKQYAFNARRLYTHNILRLAAVYIFWSGAYGLMDCYLIGFGQLGWKDIVKQMLYGRFHLWFLPMITGIYVLLPVLRVWVHNAGKKNLQYFLVLFFVLQICGQTVRAFWMSDDLEYVLNITEVELVCGYVGYFVLGYYMAHVGISPKYHRFIYASVVPAGVLNVVLGNYLSLREGVAQGTIYDSFGLFTFCIVVGLFLFFTEKVGKMQCSDRMARLIGKVSQGTMGVYVLHVGMMELSERHGIHSMTIPIIAGIPVYAALCFAVCLLVSLLLRRIPAIGRYLV